MVGSAMGLDEAEAVEGILAGHEQCFYCEKWYPPNTLAPIGHAGAEGKLACRNYYGRMSCVEGETAYGDKWREVFFRKTGIRIP